MDPVQDATASASAWQAIGPLIAAQQARIADLYEARTQQSSPSASATELSDADKKTVEVLQARDREVRDHEQAHKRVGGGYASQPTYTYQTGPDGRQYAVGGEVLIDASPVADNPEATIVKMEIVKRAALAPAEPSSADRKVAAQADATKAQAMAELSNQDGDALRGEDGSNQGIHMRKEPFAMAFEASNASSPADPSNQKVDLRV